MDKNRIFVQVSVQSLPTFGKVMDFLSEIDYFDRVMVEEGYEGSVYVSIADMRLIFIEEKPSRFETKYFRGPVTADSVSLYIRWRLVHDQITLLEDAPIRVSEEVLQPLKSERSMLAMKMLELGCR